MIQVYSCDGMGFYRDALLRMGFEQYRNPSSPALFLGTYFKSDVDTMARHRGPGYVFWNGADAVHLGKNPEWVRVLRGLPLGHATHHDGLADEVGALLDVPVEVSPTLFRDPMDYPIMFVPSVPRDYFMNTHEGRHAEYGVPEALALFETLDPSGFRLFIFGDRPAMSRPENVQYCGRWPETAMDRACSMMHGALRLNEHDGTSQIVLKSRLWGQWPVVHRRHEPGLRERLLESSGHLVASTRDGLVLNTFIDAIRRNHA